MTREQAMKLVGLRANSAKSLAGRLLLTFQSLLEYHERDALDAQSGLVMRIHRNVRRAVAGFRLAANAKYSDMQIELHEVPSFMQFYLHVAVALRFGPRQLADSRVSKATDAGECIAQLGPIPQADMATVFVARGNSGHTSYVLAARLDVDIVDGMARMRIHAGDASQEPDAISVVGDDTIVDVVHRIALSFVVCSGARRQNMATEVFSWGYIAWVTQRPSGYLLSGYIDGREFDIVADTPQKAGRLFARAARWAWLRRKFRVFRGLPARELEHVSTADRYYDVSLRTALVGALVAIGGRLLRARP
jgi:hypothetical protein